MTCDQDFGPPQDDERTGPFRLPLPPPIGADSDVLWVSRHPVEAVRNHEDIMLRRVPRAIAQQFRGAAGGRGLTHAQYLTALIGLHEAMRERADGGDAELGAELDRLGLSTVSI